MSTSMAEVWARELEEASELDRRAEALEIAAKALGLPEPRWLNHYHCVSCNEDWDDEWSCQCDDECGKCGADISPHDSTLLNPEDFPDDHDFDA